VTEGGVDRAGIFHRIAHLDDSRLAEIFAREVLAMLLYSRRRVCGSMSAAEESREYF
jgi:hypothetical protein